MTFSLSLLDFPSLKYTYFQMSQAIALNETKNFVVMRLPARKMFLITYVEQGMFGSGNDYVQSMKVDGMELVNAESSVNAHIYYQSMQNFQNVPFPGSVSFPIMLVPMREKLEMTIRDTTAADSAVVKVGGYLIEDPEGLLDNYATLQGTTS